MYTIVKRDVLDPSPIYYTVRDGEFIYSRSLRELLNSGIMVHLSPLAFQYLLALGYLPFNLTLIEGVNKLIPGEEIIVKEDASTTRRMTPMPGDKMDSPVDLKVLRSILEEAVMNSVRDVKEACAALSGGMDTSTIIALARSHLDRLHTFTMGFGLPTDEFEDARIVSDHFDTIHHEIFYDFAEEVENYPELVYAMEEPRLNLYVEKVHREASPYSKRFLCGLGGDELFKGYQNTNRFKLARRLSKLSRIPGGITLASFLRNRLIGVKLTDNLKRDHKWLYVTFVSPLRYNPSLWMDAYQRMDLIGVEYMGDFEEYCYLVEFRTKMIEDTLVPEYKMAEIHHLDIKFPLLDRQLFKTAFSIPFRCHIRGGEGKILMKEMVKELLPERCLRKSKRGFSLSPIQMYEKAQPSIDDLLKGSEPVRRYFGPDNLAKVKEEFESGRNRYVNARTLILLYGFHFWAERFLQ
ncbi:MAG: asparagine synthase C-terminal domain-containing protein [Candidatus Bathyarchaeia archaeon]